MKPWLQEMTTEIKWIACKLLVCWTSSSGNLSKGQNLFTHKRYAYICNAYLLVSHNHQLAQKFHGDNECIKSYYCDIKSDIERVSVLERNLALSQIYNVGPIKVKVVS